MLYGLSTSHQIGLAVIAGTFIVFSIASSFLFPAFSPNFPGEKGLRWYLPLTVVLFVVMMGGILVLAKEKGGNAAEAKAAASGGSTETSTSAGPKGDATAGKALFMSSGCAACHTYKAAGSTGQAGPNLDNLAADAQKANQGSLDEYIQTSIKDPSKYIVPGFQAGMPPFASFSQKQLADLTAFLGGGAG